MAIDMSAAKTPKAPARRSGSSPRSTSAPKAQQASTKTDLERREDGLNGLGQLGQGICVLTKQYADAGAIGAYWPGIASETAKLAEQNEAVAKYVDIFIQAGPYLGLVTAVLPFALQILANHRVIDPGNLGVVAPELLASQVQTGIAQQKAAALRQQEEELRAALEEQAHWERISAEREQEVQAMMSQAATNGWSVLD